MGVYIELCEEFGGDRGTRTPNLGDANAALSQVELYPLKKLTIRLENLLRKDYSKPFLRASTHLGFCQVVLALLRRKFSVRVLESGFRVPKISGAVRSVLNGVIDIRALRTE